MPAGSIVRLDMLALMTRFSPYLPRLSTRLPCFKTLFQLFRVRFSADLGVLSPTIGGIDTSGRIAAGATERIGGDESRLSLGP